MKLVTNELIQKLLSANQATCLSLYMPTHRSHPEKLQDPIRFKNLVKQMEESLLKKYSTSEVQKHLEPIESLMNDNNIWNYTMDGLAVFSSVGLLEVIGLQESVDELAMVADSFHTKPLRQYLQSVDRYHVLGLSHHDYRIFEGNRHSLVEVELNAKTPNQDIDELGNELTENLYTGASNSSAEGESISRPYSQAGRKDDTDNESERFFRDVAKMIEEHYSKPTGWPLILAALPENQHLFQKVNKNSQLLDKGIAINPDSISIDKLTDLAWEIMEPEYLIKLDNLIDRYEQAKAHGKGSDNIKEVAVAAVEGRIDTLIVEADRLIAVRITNLVSGNTQKRDLENPSVDDLLDDMGELVTKMGGHVMVFSPEKMPSQTGLAAIFRY